MRAAQGQPADHESTATFGHTTTTIVNDPQAVLKTRVSEALLSRLGTRLYDASLSAAQLNQQVVEELSDVLDEETVPLTDAERELLVAEICDDVLGYGPIERFLADPTVTEIMVNGVLF